ncbi:MAG: DUF2637 domain-containing protein [Anaerolineales bacterium]|nr:DUF2637 domain-containing protein [Anaerolineales bacterium]
MTANRIERWVGKMLVFLAVSSFILSFAGMYAVAVDSGYGWLAWLWPLVTESAVVIFSLVLLAAKLEGYKNLALQPMIVTCTALSVGFNVLHAPEDKWLARAVVAFPPIFLYAAFKTWIWKVEQDTRRAGLAKTIADLTSEIDNVNDELQNRVQELDKLNGQIEQQQDKLNAINQDKSRTDRGNVQELNDARQTKIDERRADVLSLLRDGHSESDIATKLDVSVRTVRRDIKALNGQVPK